MSLKTFNISRGMAENFGWVVDNRSWMISIYSSNSTPANITAPFGKIFPYQFDDIVKFEDGYRRMTFDQATEIAKIIMDAKECGADLWVHCDAGVCRSGAIVEAAKLVGFYHDTEVSNEHMPNEFVFKAVRKALGFLHSFEEND